MRRTTWLGATVTPGELTALKAVARAMRRSQADTLRELIRAAYKALVNEQAGDAAGEGGRDENT
jgi:hypothetical protein